MEKMRKNEREPETSTEQATCVRCDKPDDKQENPSFQCRSCNDLVHSACVASGSPSPLIGDVFFEYTCASCSPNGELFVRSKITWVCVIILTLHHLQNTAQGIANHGFFHYKTHIACFIDKNWITLFGNSFKQKKNWIGTLVGALSNFSGVVFQSSSTILGEQGWWKLKHKASPALCIHLIQEISKDRAALTKAKRNKLGIEIKVRTIEELFKETGYKNLIFDEISQSPIKIEPVLNATVHNPVCTIDMLQNLKQEKIQFPANTIELNPIPASMVTITGQTVSDVSKVLTSVVRNVHPTASTEVVHPKKRKLNSMEGTILPNHQYSDFNTMDSDSSYDFGESSASYCRESYNEESEYSSYLPSTSQDVPWPTLPSTSCDSDSRSRSPIRHETYTTFREECEKNFYEKRQPNKHTENSENSDIQRTSVEANRTSLFSEELNSLENIPWRRKIVTSNKTLMRLTEYEEIQLLKMVESMIPDVKKAEDKAYLERFRAKLALRRLKRNRHLPLFDIDNTVKYLGGYSTDDPRVSVLVKERVLDRFQTTYTIDSNAIPIILVGHSDEATFRSPYSGTTLKPFIRRDTETIPLWIRVTEELLHATNKNNPHYVPPQRYSIDYSYMKPHHIAAVNNMCSLFFWPGIDVTECLQYPEFSCVVTYNKVVVGFALLVPDAGRSAAYVSFVLVRPEWRRANIATFMLYHLLQTCAGQDVTLHVSPTNPAVFLYHKFGFKVEELVQDFYEKYFEINSKECRHALFLRLTR